MTSKNIRIEYLLRADVDLGEYVAELERFVRAIGGQHPEHRYTAFQSAKDPRRFVHVGELVEEALPSLQSEPFFPKFGAFLRERCETGPDSTWMTKVASTR